MNERIKELAEQAGFIDWLVLGRIESKEEVLEKFAQLIVRECSNALYDNEMGGYRVDHCLNEHFGIK